MQFSLEQKGIEERKSEYYFPCCIKGWAGGINYIFSHVLAELSQNKSFLFLTLISSLFSS